MSGFWESIASRSATSIVESTVYARTGAIVAEAEARRVSADYNTGSITDFEAYLLAMLAFHLDARVVIEVGTFIGTSTLSLAVSPSVEAVYTCDASNDCLPSSDVVRTYPKTSSQDMLADLRRKGVKADLCFFDGTLRPVDSDALKGLTHKGTVYAFHDYNYGPKIRTRQDGSTYLETMPRKGMGNVDLLRPWLSKHALIVPPEGTTLALLVPESML